MKQELDQKLANLHTKLSNIVLDEMDRQLDKIKLFDGNQQAATESPKTDSSRQTEKAINHTQKENISPITQTKVQHLTGQPLSYKKSADQNLTKQKDTHYNIPPPIQIPTYAGNKPNIDYHTAHHLWPKTASNSAMQNKQELNGNRNMIPTSAQQSFLAQQSLNLNRM
ncbi:unnamed protein product [Mytilus coruscus]|uniref:Uncharacterized protein n=1 Tax=Mytilus coruscus TaxID=42192 RepID=A0A6J8AUV4_MYTCO|nr:unnamed protein product [Mytilus coruscus]